MSSGYPVVPPSEREGVLVPYEISNLSTTVQTFAWPSGAKWVELSYRLLPGATATAGQYAKVVFNAVSDADAAGKLALAGGYLPLYQGDDLLIPADSITRVDIVAAQAVGSEVTSVRVAAGVNP